MQQQTGIRGVVARICIAVVVDDPVESVVHLLCGRRAADRQRGARTPKERRSGVVTESEDRGWDWEGKEADGEIELDFRF